MVVEKSYDVAERKGHRPMGLLKTFREDRLRFLVETVQMATLVKFRLGPRHYFLVSHPDLIRDVLVSGRRHLVRDPLVRKILEKTLGGGLLTSEGGYWKRQRRMIAPALHLQRVRDYANVMVEHALAAAERWQDGHAIHARRESHADAGDLLSMMVRMTDAETGERMTDDEIRAEVITLYLAGYETTALTLTYAWYEMARRPAVEARFHAELDHVLGTRPPRINDLDRLVYTQMVFKEALRLYPPAYMIVRAVAEPIVLGGQRIPKGSVLMFSPFAMHRHPALWEEPGRFEPERFADQAERGWPQFKYFPFGGGPHTCVGNQFALVEGALILATLGQRYRFELLQPGQPLAFDPKITLGLKGGMPLRFRRRVDAPAAAMAAPA